MTFEKPEDAVKAIEDYNGAYLDEKVLVVQYDMVPQIGKFMKTQSGGGNKG